MFTSIKPTLHTLDSTGEHFLRYHFHICGIHHNHRDMDAPRDVSILSRDVGLHEGEAAHAECRMLLRRDACDLLAMLIFAENAPPSEHFTLTRKEYVRPQPPPESGRPLNCECDNTHENNRSCCPPCWAAGFRAVPNPKPATTYAFTEGQFVRLYHGRPDGTLCLSVEDEAKKLVESLTPEERDYVTIPDIEGQAPRGFAALHDLCDANMRLPGSDDASGIPACDQAYVEFCYAVMSRFNELLLTPKA